VKFGQANKIRNPILFATTLWSLKIMLCPRNVFLDFQKKCVGFDIFVRLAKTYSIEIK
jgi:hypothetical protein